MDDFYDSETEFMEDEKILGYDLEPEPKKLHARQRYDRLMEEKRLALQMEHDLLYWQ